MKKLLSISALFTTLLCLSCGQSENEKQMDQKLTALTHYKDSIKQDAVNKKTAAKLKREQEQLAKNRQADKEKLVKENLALMDAKQELVKIMMPLHLFRSKAEKEAQIENQTQVINTIQDSINVISNRINGNCIVWTPYNSYVTVYVDGDYIGSTQGAGIENGVSTTVNSTISHSIKGENTANGNTWSGNLQPFPTDQKMQYELQ